MNINSLLRQRKSEDMFGKQLSNTKIGAKERKGEEMVLWS